MDDVVVNGKVYPMWQQFVHRKEEWIGGTLREANGILGDAGSPDTEILDIRLEPSGATSAIFRVVGKRYECASDVEFLGVTGQEIGDGFLAFSGYGGHLWGIKQKQP